MSITSQQLESWIPSEDTATLNLNDLETIDLSGLNSYDFSSLTTTDMSTITISPTSGSYTIPSISALTTADIITLTGPGGGGGTSYTWSNGSGGSYSGTSYTFKMPEEWIDCFPDFNRIKKMCEEYPGLKIAYEKFLTTYEMVKVDYDNPENKK